MIEVQPSHDLYNLVCSVLSYVREPLGTHPTLSRLITADILSPAEISSISTSLTTEPPSPKIEVQIWVLLDCRICLSSLHSASFTSRSVHSFLSSFNKLKQRGLAFCSQDDIVLFVGRCCESALASESVLEISFFLEGLKYARDNELHEGLDLLLEQVIQAFEVVSSCKLQFQAGEELDEHLNGLLRVSSLGLNVDLGTHKSLASFSAIAYLCEENRENEIGRRIIGKLLALNVQEPSISIQIKELQRNIGATPYNGTGTGELVTCRAQLIFKERIIAKNKDSADPQILLLEARLPSGIVAVKEYSSPTQEKVQFEGGKEANILCRFSGQPNFLKYYGHYQEFTEPWHRFGIVIELCSSDLMTHIGKATFRGFEAEELQVMCRELIHAFADMHSKGYFHLDIKPQNLLLKDGHIKIADFNVSDVFEPDSHTIRPGNYPIQGTSGYMAPELQVHQDKRVNDRNYRIRETEYIRGRADVYSLGLTILQMHIVHSVEGMNTQERQIELQAELNQIPFIWLRRLLESMLVFRYQERPDMEELKRLLPSVSKTEKATTSFLRD